jgi:hypothetical protein
MAPARYKMMFIYLKALFSSIETSTPLTSLTLLSLVSGVDKKLTYHWLAGLVYERLWAPSPLSDTKRTSAVLPCDASSDANNDKTVY